MNNEIAAVVVTFNRLKLLKKVINNIKNQTHKPDSIIIVNNSSTDGTTEWLEKQQGLDVIHQDNLGSSGGQYTGFKAAYDKGFEFLWIMDDDVVPEKDCLENLIKHHKNNKQVLAPLRYSIDNSPYINDTIKFNLNNPLKSIWTKIIDHDLL